VYIVLCSSGQNFDDDFHVDWRQPKPKMHVPSQNDPAPDSQTFRDHVICEHGHLALNLSARTRISHKVRQQPLRLGSDFMALRLSHCSRHSFHHGTPCLMLSAHVQCVPLSQRTRARIKGSYAKRRRKKRCTASPFMVTNLSC
jgi:hypothetical protein